MLSIDAFIRNIDYLPPFPRNLVFGCGHQALAFRWRAEALDLAGIISEHIPRYMTKAFYALGGLQALLNIQV